MFFVIVDGNRASDKVPVLNKAASRNETPASVAETAMTAALTFTLPTITVALSVLPDAYKRYISLIKLMRSFGLPASDVPKYKSVPASSVPLLTRT